MKIQLKFFSRYILSKDLAEIASCLKMIKNSNAGIGFMHETFNKDDPKIFSRSWFAWSNTLFGELIIKVEKEHPEFFS